MVCYIQIDQNANYMVTMFGLDLDNFEDRVLLSNGQKEMTIMKMLKNYLIGFYRTKDKSYLKELVMQEYIDLLIK